MSYSFYFNAFTVLQKSCNKHDIFKRRFAQTLNTRSKVYQRANSTRRQYALRASFTIIAPLESAGFAEIEKHLRDSITNNRK